MGMNTLCSSLAFSGSCDCSIQTSSVGVQLRLREFFHVQKNMSKDIRDDARLSGLYGRYFPHYEFQQGYDMLLIWCAVVWRRELWAERHTRVSWEEEDLESQLARIRESVDVPLKQPKQLRDVRLCPRTPSTLNLSAHISVNTVLWTVILACKITS